MNLTGKIAVQNFKRTLGAVLAVVTVASAAVHAAQTVEPRFTVGGAAITGTQSVPAGSTFSFFGVYSSPVTESGLGLKVKYNGLHLTNVQITEEFQKCRIAAAQYPASNAPPTTPTATDQVVMGWIDTAIRPSGAPLTATGAVGWPDVADQTPALCLNPGSPAAPLNTLDSGAVATTGLKLFKFTATMASTCSTPSCNSTVTLDSDGNFSYAGASPGMTPAVFTIAGAAAPAIALAATNPYVSRKTHGGAGDFDITIDPSGSATAGQPLTVEPRQPQSGSHQIVVAFTASVSAAQYPTITATAGAAVMPTTTTFSGNQMTITVGNAGTPVPNGTRLVISAPGAGTAAGVNANIVIGFLLGDVTGNRAVNSTDASQVRGQNLVAVTSANFINDVNVNGAINSTDASLTRGQNLQTLP